MRPYRCFFFDRAGHITFVEILDCADDEAACRAAQELQRQRGGFAVEVWDEGRRVLRSLETCSAGTADGT
jgi:hypothetical protein